jgi:GT2 family glycosyltransferase
VTAAGTVSVVLVVANRVDLTRACLASLERTTLPFELCVVDNASTDGTAEHLAVCARPPALRYARNRENVGLIRALNQGARLAQGEFLCFLHNDTEMLEPRWLERLRSAVVDRDRVGLAGLYGAQRVRRDGRYVGRTIVHALAEDRAPDRAPAGDAGAQASVACRGRPLPAPAVEVAAVDGVCLFLRRALLESIGGFDEGYGFFHGYDRDLSFAVRETGQRCVVVDAPFIHRGGGTRTGAAAPVRATEDLVQRRVALARFAGKWRRRLPCDVRTLRERLLVRLRASRP